MAKKSKAAGGNRPVKGEHKVALAAVGKMVQENHPSVSNMSPGKMGKKGWVDNRLKMPKA